MKKLLLLLSLITLSYAGVGKITAIRGDALIISSNGNSTKAILNQELEESDIIKTENNARLQIIFNDNTVTTLGKNTTLEIKQYIVDGKNSKANLEVKEGSFKVITGEISKLARKNFTLKAQTATIGIRGTIFIGEISESVNKLACLQGAIDVKVGDKIITLESGKQVSATKKKLGKVEDINIDDFSLTRSNNYNLSGNANYNSNSSNSAAIDSTLTSTKDKSNENIKNDALNSNGNSGTGTNIGNSGSNGSQTGSGSSNGNSNGSLGGGSSGTGSSSGGDNYQTGNGNTGDNNVNNGGSSGSGTSTGTSIGNGSGSSSGGTNTGSSGSSGSQTGSGSSNGSLGGSEGALGGGSSGSTDTGNSGSSGTEGSGSSSGSLGGSSSGTGSSNGGDNSQTGNSGNSSSGTGTSTGNGNTGDNNVNNGGSSGNGTNTGTGNVDSGTEANTGNSGSNGSQTGSGSSNGSLGGSEGALGGGSSGSTDTGNSGSSGTEGSGSSSGSLGGSSSGTGSSNGGDNSQTGNSGNSSSGTGTSTGNGNTGDNNVNNGGSSGNETNTGTGNVDSGTGANTGNSGSSGTEGSGNSGSNGSQTGSGSSETGSSSGGNSSSGTGTGTGNGNGNSNGSEGALGGDGNINTEDKDKIELIPLQPAKTIIFKTEDLDKSFYYSSTNDIQTIVAKIDFANQTVVVYSQQFDPYTKEVSGIYIGGTPADKKGMFWNFKNNAIKGDELIGRGLSETYNTQNPILDGKFIITSDKGNFIEANKESLILNGQWWPKNTLESSNKEKFDKVENDVKSLMADHNTYKVFSTNNNEFAIALPNELHYYFRDDDKLIFTSISDNKVREQVYDKHTKIFTDKEYDKTTEKYVVDSNGSLLITLNNLSKSINADTKNSDFNTKHKDWYSDRNDNFVYLKQEKQYYFSNQATSVKVLPFANYLGAYEKRGVDEILLEISNNKLRSIINNDRRQDIDIKNFEKQLGDNSVNSMKANAGQNFINFGVSNDKANIDAKINELEIKANDLDRIKDSNLINEIDSNINKLKNR